VSLRGVAVAQIEKTAFFGQTLASFNAAQVLPFDRAAGDMFLNMKKQRVRVATMDLRIASIALSRGMTLLSRNLTDFSKVPALKIEDWTA
jgi:tRNA(fMet)-specific endonuclease VapC